jgi:membrane protease YdiL (CAAX protease family)
LDSFDPIPPTSPDPPPPLVVVLAPTPSKGPENPVFNLVDVLLIVVVAIGSLLFCGLLAMTIASARHWFHGDMKDVTGQVLVFLPAQVAAYIVTIGFMVLLIWQRYKMNLGDAIGWNAPPAPYAWVAFASGAGLGLMTELLSGLLQRWIPKSLPIEQYFSTPSAAYALAAFGILVAPLVEEMFFRGFLYPALARPLGVAASMVLTAGGFALIHAQQLAHAWVPLLILFTVGLVLTAIRAKLKSVAVCVLVHMGYNTALFTLLFIVTHGFRQMERAS